MIFFSHLLFISTIILIGFDLRAFLIRQELKEKNDLVIMEIIICILLIIIGWLLL